MTLSGQCHHSLGNVYAFYLKSLRPQIVNEAAIAPASHIERVLTGLQELHGPLVLRGSPLSGRSGASH
jgi:hypothetical protein